MPRYIVESCTRYLVEHADTPGRVLQWFADTGDNDVDVSPISYDHLQVIGTVGDDFDLVQLEPGTYAAWRAENVVPLTTQQCLRNNR